MSSEIILDENTLTTKKRVKHGLQHDLESFFWVLCWLATHFVMPGRMIAKEDIPGAVSELFDEKIGPTVMALRKKLFWHENSFDEMSECMTPYFRPLEHTLKSWMRILHVFYKETARASRLPAGQQPGPSTYPLELLHICFLNAINKVVVNDDMDDQYTEVREAELEHRREDFLPQSTRRRSKRKVTREHRMDVDG